MNPNQQRRLWQIAATGSAILAGIATRKALQSGWRRVKDEEPPENPDVSSVSWTNAILWAAMTGAAVGVSKMLVTRSVSLSLHRHSELKAPDKNLPGVKD